MNAHQSFGKFFAYATAAVCLILPGCVAAQSGAETQTQDEEVQMGQEVFNELKAKGEIIESSPLYDQLKPIADAITRAAQPRYNHPFKFYLVHETQPNAFRDSGRECLCRGFALIFRKEPGAARRNAVPRGLTHHPSRHRMSLMEKQPEDRRSVRLRLRCLLAPLVPTCWRLPSLGKLHSLGYSRDVESRADITGSDICAQTGYNPWGLVWLFQDFQNANPNQLPQLLSDHPDDQNRVNALEQHFRKNPSVFKKFNPDPKSATPISVPKNAPEVFMH